MGCATLRTPRRTAVFNDREGVFNIPGPWYPLSACTGEVPDQPPVGSGFCIIAVDNIAPTMKSVLVIACSLLANLSFCQTTGKLLIISNTRGEVEVDGRLIGTVEPNSPLIQVVTVGDHLVQLEYVERGRPAVKNELVSVEAGRQKAVEFTITSTPSAPVALGMDTVFVADLPMAIPGRRTVGDWQREHRGEDYAYPTCYYAFEKGDLVVLDSPMRSALTSNSIDVFSEPDGVPVYSKRSFSALTQQTFPVYERCILRFRLSTEQPYDRATSLRIRRIPASKATVRFNPEVKWRTSTETIQVNKEESYFVKNDTVITELLGQTLRVQAGDMHDLNSNKTLLTIDLPKGTFAWGYFIGAGTAGRAEFERARERFRTSGDPLLKIAAGADPLTPLLLGSPSPFERVDGMEAVKYYLLANADQAQMFRTGQGFDPILQGDVVCEAAEVRSPLEGRVHLGLANDNMLGYIDVMVKVSAAVLKERYATRTVQVPQVVTRKVPYTLN